MLITSLRLALATTMFTISSIAAAQSRAAADDERVHPFDVAD